ncbi:MAG: hypothetical protein KF761_04100 [Salinibacterium sp.]|nr:hypothetical protein [Salinibacterium sp.]
MNDDDLADGFERGTLSTFPHESHVRTVFILVRWYGEADALARLKAGIRALAVRAGKLDKYHDTRTVAWFTLIVARMGDDADSITFLARHPEFLRRDLLDDYYTAELLNSPAAREAWVAPDR